MIELLNVALKGKIFKHYKTNNLYVIHHIAIDSDTLELVVVYGDGHDSIYTRPLSDFSQMVSWGNKLTPRFLYEKG